MLRDHDTNDELNNWSDSVDEHGRACDRLHHRLKRIVKARTALDAQELEQQVRVMLDKELGERLDEDAVLAAAFRHLLDGRSAQRKGPAYQVAVTICDRCNRGWQDGGAKTVEMSPAAIDRAACDAVHVCSLEAARGAGPEQHARPPRATSAIPPATRRGVLRRDHGRCRVTGCSSARNLDLHHIEPTVGHTPTNLLTLCEAHHLAAHAGALKIGGDASAPTFTRTRSSNYKNASIAVDVAKALRTLGFTPHEVKTAVAQAKTHVGTADLTFQQWIKLALGYCPEPTG